METTKKVTRRESSYWTVEAPSGLYAGMLDTKHQAEEWIGLNREEAHANGITAFWIVNTEWYRYYDEQEFNFKSECIRTITDVIATDTGRRIE